jgi:hypothetical protein
LTNIRFYDSTESVEGKHEVVMLVKKKKKKSILSLGGIAKGRKAGVRNGREYSKKVVSKRIAKEGIKDK